ncbi:uncharacterized protein LOC143271815 [Peromyscus maniculatus bairdii]|uniref:uncharacterized protein LOC143271815 n=1 Tax=Peromyscus maniculatus bairdii TaxID=230844 RepID=UPI003FD111F3
MAAARLPDRLVPQQERTAVSQDGSRPDGAPPHAAPRLGKERAAAAARLYSTPASGALAPRNRNLRTRGEAAAGGRAAGPPRGREKCGRGRPPPAGRSRCPNPERAGGWGPGSSCPRLVPSPPPPVHTRSTCFCPTSERLFWVSLARALGKEERP